MNDVKLALLGGPGAGKSDSLYHKRLSVDGRQLNLKVFDPCSQSSEARCIVGEPLDWADGFVVVYDISDRASFINAKNVLRQIREARGDGGKGSEPRRGRSPVSPVSPISPVHPSHPRLRFRDTEVPVCLVGNKQDLCHARQVCEVEGRCLAQETRCHFQEVSAAESYQDVAHLFTRLIRRVMERLKLRSERRRYSGSRSMAKIINNVFGKRRKSV
ncbi:RERG/RAS-like b isoform X2 [Antennarius striatus]|uniref:RERG/RAS-like b isoform X2 n=1 Tax=Antennarius striatus TaxID=241820 RepID=UPI0035B0D19F